MPIEKTVTLATLILHFDEKGNITDRTRNDRVVVREGDKIIAQGLQGAEMDEATLARYVGVALAGANAQVTRLTAAHADLTAAHEEMKEELDATSAALRASEKDVAELLAVAERQTEDAK